MMQKMMNNIDQTCSRCGSESTEVIGTRNKLFIGYYELQNTIVCSRCGNVLYNEVKIKREELELDE